MFVNEGTVLAGPIRAPGIPRPARAAAAALQVLNRLAGSPAVDPVDRAVLAGWPGWGTLGVDVRSIPGRRVVGGR